MKIISTIVKTMAAALMLTASVACDKKNPDPDDKPEVLNPDRRVLLFYECGFNNLGEFLDTNLNSSQKGLSGGYIPKIGEDVILIYSKIPKSYYDSYHLMPKPVESYLRRIYNKNGKIISDTLKTFDNSVMAADPSTLREVLNLIKESFPARGYGLVVSSHGSGWLPEGYYYSPSGFEERHSGELSKSAGTASPQSARTPRRPVPEGNLAETDPFYGKVRSIGQEYVKGNYFGNEMSVSEFAGAIPYRLDYILFDMCFTAGVEVVYGLKDKADYLGLSPAEVMGDGMFDYTKLTTFLLKGDEPDLAGLFKDSYEMYNRKSGTDRSATVNVIRTAGVDNLTAVCKNLIKEYSDTLANAPTSQIQGYFRQNRHYFYDLRDIFAKCGATENELRTLDKAIRDCVIYKNSTPRMISFEIKNYSGFSMYLPCDGTELLDLYYKKEAWNDAVGLVK